MNSRVVGSINGLSPTISKVTRLLKEQIHVQVQKPMSFSIDFRHGQSQRAGNTKTVLFLPSFPSIFAWTPAEYFVDYASMLVPV